MNAERLRTLLAVLDTGSLSGAAQRLGYTPSGVSRMMAALEDETGFPLLARTRKGVQATAECAELLPQIREYLYLDSSLQQKADALRGLASGKIRIGTAYNSAYPILRKVLLRFGEKYPGIEVELVSGFTSELLRGLDERELNLAIVTVRRDEGEYEWKRLGTDEMLAWVPDDSRYSECEAVPMQAFAQEPYIDQFPGQDIDNNRILRGAGIRPNVRMTAADTYAAWAMVEAGLGIAMNSRLNSTYRKGTVKVLPLEPRHFLEIGLACKKDASPAARKFIEFCEGIEITAEE